MNTAFPLKFKSLQLQAYGQPLVIEEVEITEVPDNHVLVKVEAAPVNHSNLAYLAGQYPTEKQLPNIPGTEGSGIIVQLGKGVSERYQIGSRVAFYTQSMFGSYGQYSIASEKHLLLMDDDLTFEEAASAFLNPVSVIAMFDIAQKAQAKAVVQNAAASAIGRMFMRYFQANGITVINIVRRQEQVDLLQSEGAVIILNQSDPTFSEQLRTISQLKNASILFDPAGGETLGELLALMPPYATGYAFGHLGQKDYAKVSLQDLMFHNKVIRGFRLTSWLRGQKILEEVKFQTELNQLLKTHLRTNYSIRCKLEQFNESIKIYEQNQTQGKILLQPN